MFRGCGVEADGSSFFSEGVPGGLSADGQRRRMAGCGAPGSNVSKLSPSIPRTFPVKRLRRYSVASLLTLPRSFYPFVLCPSLCLPLALQNTTPLTCTSHKHAQPE